MEFLNGKNIRIVILAVLDMLTMAFAAIGALILRFDMSSIPEEYLGRALGALPLYCILAVAVMTLFKLYNRVWTYASINELMAILKASATIEVIILCYHVIINPEIAMPRSYYILGFGASSLRIWDICRLGSQSKS